MTDTVYLPTLMREHYHREMEMLQLFAEILPIFALCSIPPPPFPIMAPALSVSQNISDTSVSGPPLHLMPGSSGTATSMGSVTPAATLAMPASGHTQTDTPLSGQQKLLSRLGSKLPSYPSAGRGKQSGSMHCSFLRCSETHQCSSYLSVANEHHSVIQQC